MKRSEIPNDVEATWWWNRQEYAALAASKVKGRVAWYYEIEKRIIGQYRFGRPFIELTPARVSGCYAIWREEVVYNAVEELATMPSDENTPTQLQVKIDIDIKCSTNHLLQQFLTIIRKYQERRKISGPGRGNHKPEGAVIRYWDATEGNCFRPKSKAQLLMEVNLSASNEALEFAFMSMLEQLRNERGTVPFKQGAEQNLNRRKAPWNHIELLDQQWETYEWGRKRGVTLPGKDRKKISKAAEFYVMATYGAMSEQQRHLVDTWGYQHLYGTDFECPPTIRWTVEDQSNSGDRLLIWHRGEFVGNRKSKVAPS